MAQSRSRFATAVCGVENSIATSTPRKFSGVIAAWFTFVSMSSFKPTEKPASGANCSISLPIFPYPTMARFLGMLRLSAAQERPGHSHVRIDGGKKLALRDFFFERMRDVNAAGPEQKRLAPRRRQHRDIGRERNHRRLESVERRKTHRRKRQDFSHLRPISNGRAQRLIDFSSIIDQADRKFRLRGVGNNIRRASAGNRADIQCRFSHHRILGQRHAPDRLQRIEKFFDGRFAEFRIRRMSHFTRGHNFVSQYSLRSQRNFALRRLAVDQVPRAARRSRSHFRPRAVALFSHDEKQAKIPRAAFNQLFRGGNHRGDDSLGVASAAPVNMLRIFAGRKKRRHRIHVRRKDDDGGSPFRVHVEAFRRHRHRFRLAIGTCRQAGEIVQQVFSYLLLVLRDRLDVDQLARHFKWMHVCFLSSTGFSLWGLNLYHQCRKEYRPSAYEFDENPQAEAWATENPCSIVILGKEWRAEKVAGRGRTKCALLLDSAPPDSSDDSGLALARPPSRLGGTAVGDFGGKFCCTFHSGLRSSSEPRPGYSLLPHLYQDAPKIALRCANRQMSGHSGTALI